MKRKLVAVTIAAMAAFGALAKTVDLSTVTSGSGTQWIDDGDVLTGTLSAADNWVGIRNGAIVTLSNVIIPSVIWCDGDATIILEGSSRVLSEENYLPAILVKAGYTLTIKGDGSLYARGALNAAGIGGRFVSGDTGLSCAGNIVIEGGEITAIGGLWGAGIGSAFYSTCGNITIKGGKVTATGGSGGVGIGSGYQGTSGDIRISGGTVNSTGGIGSGSSGDKISSCGNIVIDGGYVTATANTRFENCAGIGCGNGGECGSIDIRYGVGRVEAHSGGDEASPIGAGQGGTCGAVTVASLLSDEVTGTVRCIENPSTISLSDLTEDIRVLDGTTLTGTLAGKYKVSIVDGAEVYLSGVTIEGGNDDSCRWAGITCEGDAVIVVQDYSVVTGFHENYPGIYVPTNHTLTLRGSPTAYLEARGSVGTSGSRWASGIGGGYELPCGNIVIEDGIVVAEGGNGAAGIGGGSGASCGTITVKSAAALCATGGVYAAGIGSGKGGSCGSITIAADICQVEATAGDNCENPIGAGYNGTCAGVSVDGDLGDVTSGSTRIIGPKMIDLSEVTGYKQTLTVEDGYTLTGELGGMSKVVIADGATVTLRDVTISGEDNYNAEWAGITCAGDATIVLEGKNTVVGFWRNYPGIFVDEGSTLAIEGEGSLTASSNGYAAGIGGGYLLSSGDIIIRGGTIHATGGSYSPGIGGGFQSEVSGDITIEKSVTMVTAVKGSDASYSIGKGKYGGTVSYGTVTIGGVEGMIEESPYVYYGQRIDLSTLTKNFTAREGDELVGTTTWKVTIPSGVNVTMNGIPVTGTGGGSSSTPEFAAGAASAVTKFEKGSDGKWTLTAFSEMSNDASGTAVADSQIKVYSASTLEGLETASPMTSGVVIEEKKSAVKTTLKVTPPDPSAPAQFFKVKFGE